MGDALFSWTTYPCVLGSDVAGEVVEVGKDVTRFRTGDRVTGLALGLTSNRAAEGAFQAYTVLPVHLTSPIPENLSFESASVISLGLSTAACGLFQKEYLALQFPSAPPKKSTGKTVLIWGGSTSVGSNAIQLAVAAGYEVITTASPKNFDYVKKLGASHAFDYKNETVVANLIDALKGKTSAGALAIGNGSADPCIEIIKKSEGKKLVALANPPSESRLRVLESNSSSVVTLRTMKSALLSGWISYLRLWKQEPLLLLQIRRFLERASSHSKTEWI